MNIIYKIHHFLIWNNDDIFLIVTQTNVVVDRTFNGLVTWNYISTSFFRTFTFCSKSINLHLWRNFLWYFFLQGWIFWNKIHINQLKSKINTRIYAISFLYPRLKKRRNLHKIYLPFKILEISGPLSSSSPKIPFHRTSEKIFYDIWKFSQTIIGCLWYKRDA